MWRVALLVLVLALTAVIGVALRRRDRRITGVDGDELLDAADLASGRAPGSPVGTDLGSHATFVQFSTPVCAGCRPAARILDGLVSQHDGLRRIEIDATQRPDLARRFDIMRTPTVLVLDASGRVVSRISGVPAQQQALAAAGLPSASGSSSAGAPGAAPNDRSTTSANGS